MLERQFHKEIVDPYQTTKKECHYNATRFLQMIAEKGGVAAAKQLIKAEGGTEGFTVLWQCGRLDLSAEALVLKPQYAPRFTEVERRICRERLEQYGYSIDE